VVSRRPKAAMRAPVGRGHHQDGLGGAPVSLVCLLREVRTVNAEFAPDWAPRLDSAPVDPARGHAPDRLPPGAGRYRRVPSAPGVGAVREQRLPTCKRPGRPFSWRATTVRRRRGLFVRPGRAVRGRRGRHERLVRAPRPGASSADYSADQVADRPPVPQSRARPGPAGVWPGFRKLVVQQQPLPVH